VPSELRVLGPPDVVAADGTPVDLPLGKPFAALCYVALERTAVGREDLAAVLWPDSSEKRARASPLGGLGPPVPGAAVPPLRRGAGDTGAVRRGGVTDGLAGARCWG
jgi:hypothetical protein